MKRESKVKAGNVAHRSGWQTFEAVFGIPFVAAIALQFILPLSLPKDLYTPVALLSGIVLIVVGVALVGLARRELARYRQPTDPGRPTGALVITGVFSISRNPLYLGGVCFVLGVALVLNLVWMLVFFPAALILCHYILIVPEEGYLAARFPEQYSKYAASVKRWIGRA